MSQSIMDVYRLSSNLLKHVSRNASNQLITDYDQKVTIKMNKRGVTSFKKL